jgi:hypothetical protein
MWNFLKGHAPQPPKTWAGPEAFFDWTEKDLDLVNESMRSHGQPNRGGWEIYARIALNTLRGGSAVELVARAIEASSNPGHDPDRPITGGHYMNGMPHWCTWVEYARPAVELIAGPPMQESAFEMVTDDQLQQAFGVDINTSSEAVGKLGTLYRRRA